MLQWCISCLHQSTTVLHFSTDVVLTLSFGLTHLPLDKMAAILADNNFMCIFLNENDKILIQISLTFFPKSTINDKSDVKCRNALGCLV